MLGHASTTITLDIYSHVHPDMQQDAAEAMGHLLFTEHADKVPTLTSTAPTLTPALTATSPTPHVSPATQHELLSHLLSMASSSTKVHPQ
jgi:hypothetical protein